MQRFGIAAWLVVSLSMGAGCFPPPMASQSAGVQPAPTAATPPSTVYQIKLRRPRQVGYQENINYVAMEKQTKITRVGGQVVEQGTKARRVELQGHLTVMQVNQFGQVMGSQIMVQKCVAQTDTGTKQLAMPGQVLYIARGEPPVVTLNQAPLGEDDLELLDLVLSMDPPGPATEDQALGSPNPQTVGASWPVDAQLTAASLSRGNMVLDPNQLQGTTTLMGVEHPGGRECLDVQVNMEIRGVQMPSLPPNATLNSGVMEFTMRALFPTDLVTPPVRDEAAMRARFQLTVATGGPPAVVELLMERHEVKQAIPVQ